jgi:hypothetical protein
MRSLDQIRSRLGRSPAPAAASAREEVEVALMLEDVYDRRWQRLRDQLITVVATAAACLVVIVDPNPAGCATALAVLGGIRAAAKRAIRREPTPPLAVPPDA